MLDISGGKIALAGEQYIASTEDTAVAIVKAINGWCCTGYDFVLW